MYNGDNAQSLRSVSYDHIGDPEHKFGMFVHVARLSGHDCGFRMARSGFMNGRHVKQCLVAFGPTFEESLRNARTLKDAIQSLPVVALRGTHYLQGLPINPEGFEQVPEEHGLEASIRVLSHAVKFYGASGFNIDLAQCKKGTVLVPCLATSGANDSEIRSNGKRLQAALSDMPDTLLSSLADLSKRLETGRLCVRPATQRYTETILTNEY